MCLERKNLESRLILFPMIDKMKGCQWREWYKNEAIAVCGYVFIRQTSVKGAHVREINVGVMLNSELGPGLSRSVFALGPRLAGPRTVGHSAYKKSI